MTETPRKVKINSMPEQDGKFSYFGREEAARQAAIERGQAFYYYYPESGVYLVAVVK